MKKSLSSSISSASLGSLSTSTTTTSTDGILDTPRTSCRTGCISTVLRRILHRKILATHPTDHEKNTELCNSEKEKCSLDESIPTEAFGRPNLVAKLMGLESVPTGDSTKDLSSVARSRSMNSAESWEGFEGILRKPRRTKSFREIPCFRQLEDENFYILSFEKGNKNRELASNVQKSEKGFTETENVIEGCVKVLGEVKQDKANRERKRRESVYEKNKENLIEERIFSQRSGSETELRDKTNVQDQKGTIGSGKILVVNSLELLSKKKESVGGNTRIKRKDVCLAVRTSETDSNSQNSNPESVLDDVQLPVKRKVCNANSQEVSSRLTSSKLRRTLWEELEDFGKLNNNGKVETLIHNNQGAKDSNDNGDGSSKIIDFESKIHAEILKKSCKLAEEEMVKLNWTLKDAWRVEDYEEVGEDLEACILGKMIIELVDQLSF